MRVGRNDTPNPVFCLACHHGSQGLEACVPLCPAQLAAAFNHQPLSPVFCVLWVIEPGSIPQVGPQVRLLQRFPILLLNCPSFQSYRQRLEGKIKSSQVLAVGTTSNCLAFPGSFPTAWALPL